MRGGWSGSRLCDGWVAILTFQRLLKFFYGNALRLVFFAMGVYCPDHCSIMETQRKSMEVG
jgi:hypothetical protein